MERPPHLAEAVRAHLPVLLYLAIGPSAVAYACWNAAVRDLGGSYAMMFNNLLPIFGMLLGGLVLHERVTVVQILASGLIIAGIFIACRSLPATSPRARPPESPREGIFALEEPVPYTEGDFRFNPRHQLASRAEQVA